MTIVAALGAAEHPGQQRRDGLVAGVGRTARMDPFEDYPEEAWDTMIDSHLKGRRCSRRRRSSGISARPATRAGSIINVSSTYGVVSPEQAIYEYKRTRQGRPTSSRWATAWPSRAC